MQCAIYNKHNNADAQMFIHDLDPIILLKLRHYINLFKKNVLAKFFLP